MGEMGDHEQEGPGPKGPATREASVAEQDTPVVMPQAHKQGRRWPEIISAAANVVVVVLASIGVIGTLYQLDLARESLDLTDRPLLKVRKLHVNPWGSRLHVPPIPVSFTFQRGRDYLRDLLIGEDLVVLHYVRWWENASSSESPVVGDATLTFAMRPRLMNVGQGYCSIRAYAVTDTVTGGPTVRRALRDPKERLEILRGAAEPLFFSMGVSPGDTLMLDTIHHLMVRSRGDTVVIHFIVVYESDSKRIFDTYRWERYKLNDILLRPSVMPDGRIGVRSEGGPAFTYLDGAEISTVWDKDASREFREWSDEVDELLLAKLHSDSLTAGPLGKSPIELLTRLTQIVKWWRSLIQ